jgi:hypothetical protein
MNLKNLINQELRNLLEGVGDKYAQKRFNIPDEEQTFNARFKKQQVQKKPPQQDSKLNGQLVGKIETDKMIQQDEVWSSYPVTVNLYKNPQSLKNFEPRIRALSDSRGNMYVADTDAGFYHDIMGRELGLGYAYRGDLYITWNRVGNTETLGFSISFLEYFYNTIDSNDFMAKEDMAERIRLAQQRNTRIKLLPFYWKKLEEGKIPASDIEHAVKQMKDPSSDVGDWVKDGVEKW